MIVVGTVYHGHLSGEFCDIVGVALLPGWQVLEIILHRIVVGAELAVHDDVESLGRGSDSVLFHSEKDGVHDGILHVGPAVVFGLPHIASPELQLVGDGVVAEVVVGLQPLHDVFGGCEFFRVSFRHFAAPASLAFRVVVYPVNHLLCSVVCGIFLRHPLFHILLPCPVVVAEGGKLHDEFMPMSRFELHIPVFRHLFHFSDDIFRVGWCRVLLFVSRRGAFSSLTLSGRLAFLFLLLLFVADEVFGLFRRHVNRRGIPLEVGILIVRQTADSGHVGALSVSLQS